MSSELGPIEILCEAPPYSVVRACLRLGFITPQDVRWCRVNRLAGTPSTGFLAWIRGTGRVTCTCGQRMPRLESYTFTFVTGAQEQYFLGQCVCCQSMFWDRP
jgi:hypothetical protein